MRALLTVVAVAAATSGTAAGVDSSLPSTHLYNASRLVDARAALLEDPPPPYANATSALGRALGTAARAAARAAAESTVYSVMNKTLSLPGVSPHNYISIGIYNHPCNALPNGCTPYPGNKPYPKPFPPSMCDNATGLPWYPCDGQTNPAAIDEGDSPRQSKMADTVQTLANGAFFARNGTGSAPLVARAKTVARTWFLDNATAMLPNLYYGQIEPRVKPPSPGHGGFIEWAGMARLVDAFELLRFSDARDGGGGGWDAAFHEELRAWWVEFERYVESKPAAGERSMTNNHGSWFDVDWQGVALFAGNASAAAEAAAEVCTERIAKQIKPNGEEWIELERAVPSGYCQYNLEALVLNADLAASWTGPTATDVWDFETPDGISLRKSIDWLMPYATGAAKWPYGEKVPHPIGWTGMFEVLRRAAVATGNHTYEDAACAVMKHANQTDSYYSSYLNLMVPPLNFEVAAC